MSEIRRGALIYRCFWRFDGHQYIARLCDDGDVYGTGSSVKDAVDALYLCLLEECKQNSIVLEVVNEASGSETLFAVGSNEGVKLAGKAARLYETEKCQKCGKFSGRNYLERLDVVSAPESSVCIVERRGIDIFSGKLVKRLSEFGLPFNSYPVTVDGIFSDFYELEPVDFVPMPIPKRAKITSSATWRCSVCGYQALLAQDAITGLGASIYVLDEEVSDASIGLFVKRSSAGFELVLKKWVVDQLRADGILKGVPIKEVYVVCKGDLVDDFKFPDYPA